MAEKKGDWDISEQIRKFFKWIGIQKEITPDKAISVSNWKLTYTEPLSLKDYYIMIHFWLIENGYSDEISGGEDQHEFLYLEKEDMSGLKEHQIKWELIKKPDNAFFLYRVKLAFKTIALAKTEIVIDGKKINADKGEVEVSVSAQLELGTSNTKWTEHPFLSFFTKIYPKKIIADTLSMHKTMLLTDMMNLQGTMKNYLKIRGFNPELERSLFSPSKAYPSE